MNRPHPSCKRLFPELMLWGIWALGLLQTGQAFQIEIVEFTEFSGSRLESLPSGTRCSLPYCTNRFAWDQVVASWNARLPKSAVLEVELQPVGATRTHPWFSFGRWSPGPGNRLRASIPGQEEEGAAMLTDTLVIAPAACAFNLRITLGGTLSEAATLRRVCLSFSQGRPHTGDQAWPPAQAPPISFAVPSLCQLDYAGGQAWCSPTAVTMLLRFWSQRAGIPWSSFQVPNTAAQVDDPAWPGTGNWAFNASWAGSLQGFEGRVLRLTHLGELRAFLDAGFPVATSVSYGLLRGTSQQPEDGHLVVVTGFTDSGDVMLNDPGSRECPVRIVSPGDFAAAWAVSRNTIYLIALEGTSKDQLPCTGWRSNPHRLLTSPTH